SCTDITIYQLSLIIVLIGPTHTSTLCPYTTLFRSIAVALAGIAVANFWLALVLLGVGWNFLYIGGTTLLTETYRPAEQAKAQGANDMLIFVTMAVSSFSSGMLLEVTGWQMLNYLAIPFVVAVGVAVLWLMALRRRTAPLAT